MSMLADKLKQTSRGGGRAIGFGAAGKSIISPMLLIVTLSHIDEELIKTVSAEKVDLILFDIKDASGHAGDIAAAMPNEQKIPWGARVSRADKESMNQLAESGCDFVVLDSESASQVLLNEKAGKVLEVDISMEDNLLRTINKLAIDALLLREKQSSTLNISHLLNYHRISNLSGKPLMVPFPRDTADLESLLEAGAKAVILEPGTRDAQSNIQTAKEGINKLPPPGSRKSRDKSSAVLPGFRPEQDRDEE